MKLNDILTFSFCHLRHQLGLNDPDRHDMVKRSRSDDSELCRELTSKYGLTEEQMQHAAERYLLGCSRSGKTIYWMIDEQGFVRDGHIGSTSMAPECWVSTLLQRRYPELAPYVRQPHCLFGQHLLGRTYLENPTESTNNISAFSAISAGHKTICVVESERTAVVMSELLPESLWLATGYAMNLTREVLKPLQGHRVMLFPPTDETQETYFAWLEVADQAQRQYHLDISVSTILEEQCTPEQKQRHIDLLDFLFYDQHLRQHTIHQ